MRQMKFLAAMQHSSSVDVATRRKEETRANSVEFEELRKVRADQYKGTKEKAEREKEIKVKMEKGRAAAWAWYQHGKGGSNERVFRSSSVSGGGAALSSTVRATERGNKSSRFRTEALETSSSHSISLPAAELAHLREASGHRRTESAGQSWDFSNAMVNRTSSLFDSHELDSMSKIIDIAVQRNGSTYSNGTSSSELNVHQGKGFPSAVQNPGGSAQYVKAQVIATPDGSQVLTRRSPSEVTRGSSSFRMSFARYSCRSVSDVVTNEETSLGGNIVRNDGQKTRATGTRDRSSWNPGRIARVYSLPRV